MLKPNPTLGYLGAVIGLVWLSGFSPRGPAQAVVAAGQAQAFAPVTDEMLLDRTPPTG